MGFLTPIALALGAAIAIPIILHLFQRQQGPRLVFPALRYLRRAEREHARRIKLRQWLLLAMRVLAVFLIAAAAARPFLRSGGSAHAPSAIVLVLDNSASSAVVDGERRVLDELKDRAIETLLRAGPDDRFWLLRAGSPWEPAVRGDALTMADRVRETEPTASAADLRAAVERAAALASAGADGRAPEVQLLSDLQATNLQGSAPPPDTRTSLLVWTPNRKAPINRGVADVEIGGGLPPRAGARSTAAVRVVGGPPGDSVNIRLSIGGRTDAAGIAPTGAAAVLQIPAQPQGMLSGFAEIDADALRIDDRRYFAARVEPVPGVAVGRPLTFLDEALTVLAEAGRIERATPAASNILITPGAAGIELARPDAAVVVFPPETAIEAAGVNRRLAQAGINWRYAAGTAQGEARFLEDDLRNEPLLRQLAQVRLRQVYQLQPTNQQSADSVTLRLSDGQPWAVRGQRASGGQFVLLASPFTLEASTLPTSPALFPLLDLLLGAWSTAPAPSLESTPGAPIALPAGARVVLHPDGSRDSLQQGESLRAPPEPGLYRVLGDNAELGVFVINAAPQETPLEYVAGRRLRDVFPNWSLETANQPDEWLRDIYHERLGREFWWPLLIALLLLLITESLAAAAGRAARSANTAEARTSPVTPAGSLTG
jgi:hypothetical protein